MSDWHWINLPGDRHEQVVADLEALPASDRGRPGTGRGMIVIQTNARSSFHVSFSHTEAPTRGTDVPCLRFVVGKRQNSMTSVGLGNPYLKKEPIDFTRQADALLTDTEKSRTYWFLYDREVAVAAMGVQANPQADSCRLLTRFKDCFSGFREEVCQQLRYVIVSSGKRPISLRVVHIDAPPDISIPRYLFDPVSWRELPWQGCSCVFQPDEAHLQLIKRAQQLIAASPLGTLYQLIGPDHLCLNAVRLLDPFRRTELQRQPQSVVVESTEEEEWRACFEEVDRRLVTVFHSAPWTFWPLRFERADCTSVSLAPIGPGAQECVGAWVSAVEAATGLRNSATHREMLTLDFAYQVFPVEGENAVQARRDLAREITALLQKEWGTMDFRDPKLAVWQTKAHWRPFQASYIPTAPTP
ncbi:unnamed protein product [Effrenium voratum]|uniref:Uncharacterized protein n=1 Tax=Effrenium voratum TaxID=2562239 RepID=A0AA36IBS5_9DINO|nr:unnamed protein product [Effrenium voratum]CAJ1460086.1 unnamed protein product [Effrenium voratum]